MVISFIFKDLEKKHKANQNTISDKVEGIALKCSIDFCTVPIFFYVAYNCCFCLFGFSFFKKVTKSTLNQNNFFVIFKDLEKKQEANQNAVSDKFQGTGLHGHFYPFYFLIALCCSQFNVLLCVALNC